MQAMGPHVQEFGWRGPEGRANRKVELPTVGLGLHQPALHPWQLAAMPVVQALRRRCCDVQGGSARGWAELRAAGLHGKGGARAVVQHIEAGIAGSVLHALLALQRGKNREGGLST